MWGDTNDVAFSEDHKSETFFPLAKCLQGSGNAMICMSWHLDAGKGWPGIHRRSE